MPHVTLGTTSAIAVITDPETGQKTRSRFTNVNRSTTFMNIAEDDLRRQMNEVWNLWGDRSDQPPAWVDSDDEALASALRSQWGVGGRPDDWEHDISGPPESAPIEAPAAAPEGGAVSVEGQ